MPQPLGAWSLRADRRIDLRRGERGGIMSRPVVGVLGGMGPEATILLQQRVLGTVNAQDDADHLPLLIDMNPQVPSRIAHLIEGTGEDPAPVLAAINRIATNPSVRNRPAAATSGSRQRV
mgnify:CR=1 FL=1